MKFCLFFIFSLLHLSASEMTGKVVGVHDGDSLTLLVGKVQYKIRLDGIDAPELGQDYGKKAKKALSSKVFGKQVRLVVSPKKADRWGRTLGEIFVGTESVNYWMVESGWAHHFVKYSRSKKLAEVEVEAKKAKLGLWKGTNVQTPDEYRAAKKRAQALKRSKESGDESK